MRIILADPVAATNDKPQRQVKLPVNSKVAEHDPLSIEKKYKSSI